MNVVISEQFRRDLQALGKEDRRHAWDAIDKLLEGRDLQAGGLQMKRMKAADVYEIRASLALRILARRSGDDLCCVRVGPHDRTLKAGSENRTGPLPDLRQLAALASSADADLETSATSMDDEHASAKGVAVRGDGPLRAFSDEELQARFGLPVTWLAAVRSLRTEEQFAAQELESVIPETAWYDLLPFFPPTATVSTGAAPTYRVPDVATANAFANGTIVELEYNLPPSSWAIIKRERRGAIFVRGGPGTGKSLLGLYRALHALDRPPVLGRPQARVLYATYTRALADDAVVKVQRLRGSAPAGLEISTVDRLVERFAPRTLRTTYDDAVVLGEFRAAVAETPDVRRFDDRFLRTESEDVILARAIRDKETYATVSRTGRRYRLGKDDRRAVWSLAERWQKKLAEKGLREIGSARLAALDAASDLSEDALFDLVVVDEVQDLTTASLGFVLSLARGSGTQRDVTLLGDGGQSIYRAGFRWADVDLRIGGGNVVVLETCERSSAEILRFAVALTGRRPEEHDQDQPSRAERPGDTPRIVRGFSDREDQRTWLVDDIRARLTDIDPQRVAVIARTKGELERVRDALLAAHIPCVEYGDAAFHSRNAVRCTTAHSAKGLEFGEVYIVGADDGTYPLVYSDLDDEERGDKIAQDARLLYVAATRARDRLTVLCGMRPSPFMLQTFSAAVVIVNVR